ncbi:hypothetical protein ACUH7Y_16470 [Clostridium beijerinckii]|uniref:Uncharacterized protein n=1 Tax=Clostridium beijerinckii TaxID=1520 RepID=A0A7X9XRH7_CLOBE|nr:hypothetical protein [Clostridium beijerinckii]NMF07622.1 hypothetical protein [Clostridium beijerinckii]
MSVKMNTKLRLIMEVITVLYLFLSILLKNSDTNISILLTFIWIAIWCIIFLYSKRLYGITDELVISILSKINRLVVYFLIFAIGIFSVFLVTPYNSFIISKVTIGIYLLFILLIATVIRLLLFIYYDRKGIYK